MNDPSQAEELPDPPRHIKKTEVLLTTPVRPPASTDYMKNLKDEEIANAWEEHFNHEHQMPYWANNLTNETTWHKPKCLNAVEACAESRCEFNSPLIVVKMIYHCLNVVFSSYITLFLSKCLEDLLQRKFPKVLLAQYSNRYVFI